MPQLPTDDLDRNYRPWLRQERLINVFLVVHGGVIGFFLATGPAVRVVAPLVILLFSMWVVDGARRDSVRRIR